MSSFEAKSYRSSSGDRESLSRTPPTQFKTDLVGSSTCACLTMINSGANSIDSTLGCIDAMAGMVSALLFDAYPSHYRLHALSLSPTEGRVTVLFGYRTNRFSALIDSTIFPVKGMSLSSFKSIHIHKTFGHVTVCSARLPRGFPTVCMH